MKQRCLPVILLCTLMLLAGCHPLPPAESPVFSASSGISDSENLPEAPLQSDDTVSGFTNHNDCEPYPADTGPHLAETADNIVVAYFSPSVNTFTAPDTDSDTMSSAGLTVSVGEEISRDIQRIVHWIADASGGSQYAIQTQNPYPASDEQAAAGGEGHDGNHYLPALAGTLKNPEQYETVCLVYPVWHSVLPAPVQSFLTEYSFGGKTILAFAVNADSQFGSSIEEIRMLQPEATVLEGLSVSQREMPDAQGTVKERVRELMDQTAAGPPDTQEKRYIQIQIGEDIFRALLAPTEAAEELASLLEQQPLVIEMSDYGNFEKVGPLGQELTSSNTQITAMPGDLMLYNGSNIVMFYGTNSWTYTPLGSVTDLTGWTEALGAGPATVTLSLPE